MNAGESARPAPGDVAPKRGSLLVVFLTVLIDLIGFGIVIPLLPVYGREYGASAATCGWLVAVFSLMQFLFAPMWGAISDRVGRRPILLLGLLGSCGSYLLFAHAHSIEMLFVSRLFAGFFGANISTAQAYVADVTTPENRAKGMGMIGAAFGIGFIFGPPIGGILSEWRPEAPGWFAAGVSLIAFSFGLTRLPESRRPGSVSERRRFSIASAQDAFKNPRLPTLLIGFFLLTFCFACFESMYLLQGMSVLDTSKRTMTLYLGAAGVCSAIVQGGMIHRLVKRHGERKVLRTGPFLLGLGFLGVAWISAHSGFLAASALVGIAYGLCGPPLSALISKSVEANRQGATLGVAQSFASLGRVLGPPFAGRLFDVRHALPFAACGVALMLLSVVFELYRRRFPRDPVIAPPG